jgi:hypothetical protein
VVADHQSSRHHGAVTSIPAIPGPTASEDARKRAYDPAISKSFRE